MQGPGQDTGHPRKTGEEIPSVRVGVGYAEDTDFEDVGYGRHVRWWRDRSKKCLPCILTLARREMAWAGCNLSCAGNLYWREIAAKVVLLTTRERIFYTAWDKNKKMLWRTVRTVEGPTRKLGYASKRRSVTIRPSTVSPKCSNLRRNQ